MPVKLINQPPLGTVKLYKRRGNRSIRVSVARDGSVRVSLPYFAPYSAGVQFALSKSKWLLAQQAQTEQILKTGDRIGKAHHLIFVASQTATQPRVRTLGSEIVVTHPADLNSADPAVQHKARTAATAALRAEAEALLSGRLQKLADQTGCSYRSVRCRQLASRWGSCSSRRDITLNIFLMQLPWELIDYVLIHELTHTKVLHHGPDFWAELERHAPNAKALRKTLRNYHSSISV